MVTLPILSPVNTYVPPIYPHIVSLKYYNVDDIVTTFNDNVSDGSHVVDVLLLGHSIGCYIALAMN